MIAGKTGGEEKGGCLCVRMTVSRLPGAASANTKAETGLSAPFAEDESDNSYQLT